MLGLISVRTLKLVDCVALRLPTVAQRTAPTILPYTAYRVGATPEEILTVLVEQPERGQLTSSFARDARARGHRLTITTTANHFASFGPLRLVSLGLWLPVNGCRSMREMQAARADGPFAGRAIHKAQTSPSSALGPPSLGGS